MANPYGERLARLEQKVDDLTEKADDISVKLDKFIEASDMRWTNFQNQSDKRYASKTTERIVYTMVGIILSAVLITGLIAIGLRAGSVSH